MRARSSEQDVTLRQTRIRRAIMGGVAAGVLMAGVEVGVEAATGAHDTDGASIAIGAITVLGVGVAGTTLVPDVMEHWESAGQQTSREDDAK